MSLAENLAPVFDEARAEAFNETLAGHINSGAIAVMLSIGHRTGLFEAISGMGPATSAQIAERTSLAERYVREWLAVMVTGGIVEYDPAQATYTLPGEHAASLTRDGHLGNLAIYGQTIAMMGAVEEPLLRRFETGDGLSYDDYPCFHAFMAEDSAQNVTAQLFDTILPLADGITDRLQSGIDVLDAGCGRGSALRALAARYPQSRFVGYDLCVDTIAFAAGAAADAGLTNIRFETRDLTHFDETDAFDLLLSFDAVHDQKDPADLLARYWRSLRPGGTYLMQDIGGSARLENNLDFPMGAFLYAISCAHCMAVSLGQGGVGLGTMWGWETAEAMLAAAGFTGIRRTVLEHDPMNVWFVSHKS